MSIQTVWNLDFRSSWIVVRYQASPALHLSPRGNSPLRSKGWKPRSYHIIILYKLGTKFENTVRFQMKPSTGEPVQINSTMNSILRRT